MRPPLITFLGLLFVWIVFQLFGFAVLVAGVAGFFLAEGSYRIERGRWRD